VAISEHDLDRDPPDAESRAGQENGYDGEVRVRRESRKSRRRRARGVVIVVVAACGRVGFEVGDGGARDAPGVPSDVATGDGPMVGCFDIDLGSAVGSNVAAGTTLGQVDDDQGCAGIGEDVSYAWTAPASGTYLAHTCGSLLDTVLYVRSCTGSVLACDDDSCGAQSSLEITAVAGQRVVIVVDGTGSAGQYQLSILGL
jgi:hypothetical protein